MASQYDAEILLNSAVRANPAPWLGLMRARQNKLEDEARLFGQQQSLLEMRLRSDETIAAARNRALIDQSRAVLDRASELDKQKLRERLILETGLKPNKGEEIDDFIIRASGEKDQRALGTLRSYLNDEASIRKEMKDLTTGELQRQEKSKKENMEAMLARSFDITDADKAAIADVRKKQPGMSARLALEATRIPADRKAQIRNSLVSIEAAADAEAAKVPKEFLQTADDLRARLLAAERKRAEFSATESGQRGVALYHRLPTGTEPTTAAEQPTGAADQSLAGSAQAFLQRTAPPGATAAGAAPAAPTAAAPAAAPSVGPAGAMSIPFRGAGGFYDWLAGAYTRGRSGAGGNVAPAAEVGSATGLNPMSPLNPYPQVPVSGPIDWGGLNPYSPSAQARPTTPVTMDARIAQIFGPDAAGLLAEAGKLSEANGVSLTDQAATFNAALSGDPAAQQQVSTVLNYLRQSKRMQSTGAFDFPQREYPGPPAEGFGATPRLYDEPSFAPAR